MVIRVRQGLSGLPINLQLILNTMVFGIQSLGGYQYATGGTTYGGQAYGSTTYQASHIQGGYLGRSGVHQVVAEEIPVESRIEYIPFEKKYIEYDQVEYIQRVPFERQIVEYEEVRRTERVPIERTITDYYAVETQIQYIPKEIEETIVEYEPIERVWERVQYLPVETQIVHYPERDNYVPQQGQFIQKYIDGGSQVRRNEQTVTYIAGGNTGYTTAYNTGKYITGGYNSGSRVGQTVTYTTGPVTYGYTSGSRVGQTVTYTQPVQVGYTNTTYTSGANYGVSGSRVGQNVTYTTGNY